MTFVVFRYVSSLANLIKIFYHEQCWILSRAFATFIKKIMRFLYFLLLLLCIVFLNLLILNHPLHPWYNFHMIIVNNLLNMLLYSYVDGLWGFLQLSLWKVLTCRYFVCLGCSLSGLEIRVLLASCDVFRRILSSRVFGNNKISGFNSTMKPYNLWLFFDGKHLYCWFSLSSCYWSIHIFYFFMIQCW